MRMNDTTLLAKAIELMAKLNASHETIDELSLANIASLVANAIQPINTTSLDDHFMRIDMAENELARIVNHHNVIK